MSNTEERKRVFRENVRQRLKQSDWHIWMWAKDSETRRWLGRALDEGLAYPTKRRMHTLQTIADRLDFPSVDAMWETDDSDFKNLTERVAVLEQQVHALATALTMLGETLAKTSSIGD